MNRCRLVLFALCLGKLALLPTSGAEWSFPRSSPEAQGVSSTGLRAFIEAVDAEVDAMHSVMVLRNGKVLAEGWWTPWAAGSPHPMRSVTASVTSMAVGLAIAERKLRLDDPVLQFFPEYAPEEPSDHLRAMRVRDLLRMTTGHEDEVDFSAVAGPGWTRAFLEHPVPFQPGTYFRYNTPASYMLAAIVQKAARATLPEYLLPRLFAPLGIDAPKWSLSPEGVAIGGTALSLRTEDVAKLGQLLLQGGRWEGKPLLPPAWVEAATGLQASSGSDPASDWEQGFGYQLWRCRHGAYRADGMGGQFCIVLPDRQAVIVITAGTRDMRGLLNLVWERLLPAFGSTPLTANDQARRALHQALARLTVRMPEGQAASAAAAQYAGKTFRFEPNPQRLDALRLEPGPAGQPSALTLRVEGVDYRIPCGYRKWEKGHLASDVYGPSAVQRVAASGAWTAENTFTVRLCFYETLTFVTLDLKFKRGEVSYETDWHPTPGKREPLLGIAGE